MCSFLARLSLLSGIYQRALSKPSLDRDIAGIKISERTFCAEMISFCGGRLRFCADVVVGVEESCVAWLWCGFFICIMFCGVVVLWFLPV